MNVGEKQHRCRERTVTREQDVVVNAWERDAVNAALDRYETALSDRLNKDVTLKESFREAVQDTYVLSEDAADIRQQEVVEQDRDRYVCPDAVEKQEKYSTDTMHYVGRTTLEHDAKVLAVSDSVGLYAQDDWDVAIDIRSPENDDATIAYEGPIKRAYYADVLDS